MATTLTATGYSDIPRAAHIGVNVLRARVTFGATSLTVSDVILLGHMPAVCTVLDGYIKGGVGGDGSILVKVGTSGSDANILAATTLSVTGALTRLSLVPVGLSLSDAAEPYKNKIIATINSEAASLSGTVSLEVMLTYAVPGAGGTNL